MDKLQSETCIFCFCREKWPNIWRCAGAERVVDVWYRPKRNRHSVIYVRRHRRNCCVYAPPTSFWRRLPVSRLHSFLLEHKRSFQCSSDVNNDRHSSQAWNAKSRRKAK